MKVLTKTCTQLGLDVKILKQCALNKKFPFKTTQEFVARIEPGNLVDPLLLQILPLKIATNKLTGFEVDPLAEKNVTPLPGVLHKYYGRVLLLVTKECAINCRFCFRQNLLTKINNWSKVLQYLQGDNTISEVILSGGDPLTLSDDQLKTIIQNIASIPHIKRIRIHTRIPIVAPKRVTNKLLHVCLSSRLPVIFVVHVNHPQEIDQQVVNALAKLRCANIVVFNQSVLLKNINDDAQILAVLSEKLFAAGVIPYYLHLLDKVKGAENFYVTTTKAKKIMRELQNKLPGYLVPKLVYEKPGAKAKIRIV